MKKPALFSGLFVFAGVACAQAAEPPAPDRRAILETVDAFFLAYGGGDVEAMEDLLAEGARRVVWAPARETTLQRGTLAGIVDFMRAPDFPKVRESYWDPIILQRGRLAVAWTPYVFYIDDERRHCGVNVFNMTKEAEQWRVESINYTVEPDACDAFIPPDAAMRPDYSLIDE